MAPRAQSVELTVPPYRAVGRHSDYDDEKAAYICTEMATGRSLRAICLEDGMPSMQSVFRWLMVNDEFRYNYATAQEERTTAIAEELFDIADNGLNDYSVDSEGNTKVNTEHIQRSRLRIDTRKWILAKMAPKKYGDKVIQELSGPDGGPIQSQNLTINLDASKLSPDLREQLRLALMEAGEE